MSSRRAATSGADVRAAHATADESSPARLALEREAPEKRADMGLRTEPRLDAEPSNVRMWPQGCF